MINLLHGRALRDDTKKRLCSRLENDSIRLPRYELSILQLILCMKMSPGTEDVSDAAFVAVAGKYDVDKATNQKENDMI